MAGFSVCLSLTLSLFLDLPPHRFFLLLPLPLHLPLVPEAVCKQPADIVLPDIQAIAFRVHQRIPLRGSRRRPGRTVVEVVG